MQFLTLILILLMLAPDADARDRKEVRLFRSQHPCPATQSTKGACVGWVVDHFKPLCAGGLDTPLNMAWQAVGPAKKKDRIEIAFCRCMARELLICR